MNYSFDEAYAKQFFAAAFRIAVEKHTVSDGFSGEFHYPNWKQLASAEHPDELIEELLIVALDIASVASNEIAAEISKLSVPPEFPRSQHPALNATPPWQRGEEAATPTKRRKPN